MKLNIAFLHPRAKDELKNFDLVVFLSAHLRVVISHPLLSTRWALKWIPTQALLIKCPATPNCFSNYEKAVLEGAREGFSQSSVEAFQFRTCVK